jgi:cytochrome c'
MDCPEINMSDFEVVAVRPILGFVGTLLVIVTCSTDVSPAQASRVAETPLATSAGEPVATIQELMQAEVDASADSIWDAVETNATQTGEKHKQPRTADEWQQVRRNAIVLIEAANLLTVETRKLSNAPFPAEAAGALDSVEIGRRIASNRPAFNQYAVMLRQTAQTLLTAIDAKDPKALVAAGGALDEVCESCHVTFWYPNQVIPAFPSEGDPRYEKIAVNPTR